MEKILRLYTYNVDNGVGEPFPNVDNQIEIYDFTYDAKRMGGAPSISCTLMHQTCLDDEWTANVYAEFNGEKYFLKQTPTSSYSNQDARYKHELELVSERIILDNVYFYDEVDDSVADHKPISNSSEFNFFGTIDEFASRLNASLKKSNVGYSVIVDDGISSEGKLLSFDKQFFSNVLQEIYNTFDLPYYFVGKEIHIGYTKNTISKVFKYGIDESLLSITKTNSNNKIVNRITGVGSSDNIPYYYPNETEKGSLAAVASDKNKTLTSSDINIVNPILYGKNIEMTVDKNAILPSSLLSFQNAKAEITRTSIGPSKNEKFPVGEEYRATHINGAPIYTYITVEFEITQAGNIKFKPQLYYYDPFQSNEQNLYDINKEVSGYYYNTEDGNTIDIFVNDGWFAINNIDVGNYVAVFSFSLYRGEKESNVKWLYAGETEIANEKSWVCNGKTYELDEIGIWIDPGVEISLGDSFYQYRTEEYIKPQPTLMPSIYRNTKGKEKFYNAENGTYMDENGEFYIFNNPYVDGKPKEHIENFDDIKPSIVGMEYRGHRIDMFSDFAYDENDSDETIEDENGNLSYKHPYLFAKLRKLGFNLFDSAIENGEMTISMTSGHCGACNFVIGVDSATQRNKVQVDSNGNLLRDEFGDVICGREGKPSVTSQDKQNNTIDNEVWIALRKDTETFGTLMPSSLSKPSTSDTFVITNILFPREYIIAAEERLTKELIKYMSLNNDEVFNYSISFSRIFFAENPDILASLNENSRISVEYNGVQKELYISSYSYKMASNSPLPEIKVDLADKLSIFTNAIQNVISGIKDEIATSLASLDFLKLALPYFVRKDIDDYVNGTLKYKKGIEIGNYQSGAFGSGGAFKIDEKGNTSIEADYLTIRKKATFSEITVQELKHVGGQLIISPAAIVCSSVEELGDRYNCYFDNVDKDGNEIINYFVVGDLARCQYFNETSRYYWRAVVAVGRNYISLSKSDCDDNSDAPEAGDTIVQLGHKDQQERQNAQIISSYGENSPCITQHVGINNFSLENTVETRISPNDNLFTGVVKIKENSIGIGNFNDLPDEVNKAVKVGGDNILRNSGFVGNYESTTLDDLDMSFDSEMYSSNVEFWSGDIIEVISESLSKSGNAVKFNNVRQSVSLINGEKYVASFYAKANGSYITFACGGKSEKLNISNEYQYFVINFEADTSNTYFNIIGESCVAYDIKLERGTIATDWAPSIYDNDKVADEFKDIQYISQAMKDGNTNIIGGLILSTLLQVGQYKDGVMENVTAGVNGGWFDDNTVAFWAGGTLSQAIKTVAKFSKNGTPTEEDWKEMANFVATHGGEVFMRGYLNALGVILRGTLETKVDGKRLIIDPNKEKIIALSDDGKEVLSIDWDSKDDEMIELSPRAMTISRLYNGIQGTSSMTPKSIRTSSANGNAIEMTVENGSFLESENSNLVLARKNSSTKIEVRQDGVYITDETTNGVVKIHNNYGAGMRMSFLDSSGESELFSISRGTTSNGNEIGIIKTSMADGKGGAKMVELYGEGISDSSDGVVRWKSV